ncbi:hypothetical protein [Candidatus Regiella endosymbiont of Tuberolachnus salignus]|uniref:hypothetical protein n=1 Tax=Candidatus Regiella endosymbiont of Tuberolachnus salignus TaxID=3077956 RepID=UPI0030CA5E50
MKTKSTRRGDFLAQMNRIVPWEKILAKLSRHYPKASPYILIISFQRLMLPD